LAAVTVSPANGGVAITLPAGTAFTLPDGTTVTVKSGTKVGRPDGTTPALTLDRSFALPGFLPFTAPGGIQSDTTANAIVVHDSTPVAIALPANANVVLAADGSQVPLPAGTSVAVRSGLPLPLFYADDFAVRYGPDSAANSVQQPLPVENLDFTTGGAYSNYN
jgi:hypothetical protein